MTDIETIQMIINRATNRAIANERRKLRKAIQQCDEAKGREREHRALALRYQKELAEARTALRSKA